MREQRDHEQDKEEKKQQFGDACRSRRNPRETEDCGNQSYDEETQRLAHRFNADSLHQAKFVEGAFETAALG